MFLSLTTTHRPATDLGFLLHKHPDRVHAFDLPFGRAHVVYPEASAERCTAALVVEVDAVGLVRRREGGLEQYVNDRPYAASSFLSVALARVFGTALAGSSKERPELARAEIPLEAMVAALPCRGGEGLVRRLFEPLGYAVEASAEPLDEAWPEWGPSPYRDLRLSARRRVADLLAHLYVLIPVLDDDKHYWVGEDEVEKLLRRSEGWLGAHPEKDLIVRRYLRHDRRLTREALARLAEEDQPDPDAEAERRDRVEEAVERPLRLHDLRLEAVAGALKDLGARRVLDLGCGEGRLLQRLVREPQFTEILGMDVSCRALEGAGRRLHLGDQARVRLVQGSLLYRDRRLEGWDAAAVVEVVEHLDAGRLEAFERNLFGHARPGAVVLTTPNADYNVRFADLPPGRLRHPDHRFEWSRAQFRAWADQVAARSGYRVDLRPVGPEDPEVGPPTQMAVFLR